MSLVGVRKDVDIEAVVSAALSARALPCGISLPARLGSSDRFALFFANGGVPQTAMTTQYRVELEGWGATPTAAKAILEEAVDALAATAGTTVAGSYVRHVEAGDAPVQYDAGAPDRSRYVRAVLMTFRPRRAA